MSGHGYEWAVTQMKQGRKVRRSGWLNCDYIQMGRRGFVMASDGVYKYAGPINDDEWELWEEPGHDWAWALDRLEEGKAVTRKGWDYDRHKGISNKDGVLRWVYSGNSAYLYVKDFRATDWVEVTS